jgi:hypothetical protein
MERVGTAEEQERAPKMGVGIDWEVVVLDFNPSKDDLRRLFPRVYQDKLFMVSIEPRDRLVLMYHEGISGKLR